MEMEIFFPGGKRVDARWKGFTIQTDQSVKGGGEASAPAPFDLFLASIGTCAGIYVLLFCEHRNIPTDEIRLIQTFERNEETHMIETMDIEIRLPADFPEKYRKPLIRSANLCAVKKHMEQAPTFTLRTTKPSD